MTDHIDMANKKPLTENEFLEINGVGKSKLEEYFEKFSKLIRNTPLNKMTIM